MKITLSNLLRQGHADKVIVYAMEHALYTVAIEHAQARFYLMENDAQTFQRRSLNAVKQALDSLAIGELVLKHESAYDEMIGQAVRDGSNALEISLGKNIAPFTFGKTSPL